MKIPPDNIVDGYNGKWVEIYYKIYRFVSAKVVYLKSKITTNH
jgi:hypothetical protein